jgi:hypothetical protein
LHNFADNISFYYVRNLFKSTSRNFVFKEKAYLSLNYLTRMF